MEPLPFDPACPPKILAGASCAFGVFDGIHQGHRHIIAKAVAYGQAHGLPTVILTFDKDPDELFSESSMKKILTDDGRLNGLAELDVDAVLVIPFDKVIASLRPEAFLDDFFGAATPWALHVGEDFRFGSKAAGTVETARLWGRAHGMEVFGYPLLEDGGCPVTSTRIRALLSEGDVAKAAKLLGRPYEITGLVEPGRQAGRDMGFKTANLNLTEGEILVGEGVYGAYGYVDGIRYKAAVSVGPAPTFQGEATAVVEAHLLDYDGDLYGQPLTIAFMEYLRPMIKFNSVEELIETVMGNIAWVRENL